MSNRRERTFSIGEAARLCGVTVKQIRHWQDREYIPEPQRVVCGERSYRQFGEEDLEHIKKIKQYLDAGFRLGSAAEKAAADILKEKEDKQDA
jgi:DNA-binding transcriptional MerR regulator